MTRARAWKLVLASALSLGPGCAFDTAPIHGPTAGTGASALDASADGSRPGNTPSAGGAPSVVPATTQATHSGGAGAGGGASGTPASMPASTAPTVATPSTPALGTPPPPAAGAPAAPLPDLCEAGSSYGLRISADLAWDGTNGGLADSGRGPAELYALVQVERADPQTHAITASGRVCGIDLPPGGNALSCSQYQLRFPDKLWDQRDLPRLELEGSYACRPDGCSLQLAPTSYVLGIQLDPPQSPWPPAGSPVSQFLDHDADGMPGVTSDIVSQASVSANSACTYTPLGALAGVSSSGPGADGNRMLLGLRAQLSAAVSLAPDCRVAQATAALQSLDLRAAGCVIRSSDWSQGMGMGMGPMGAAQTETMCPEELRVAIDQSMPGYQPLSAGQAPAPSVGGRDTSLSRGTLLRAVRFAGGAMPTCDQVRMATK